MRILMISNHLGVQSGVQRYVQNLLLHLDTARYQIDLFVGQCPPDQASTAPALQARGVHIIAVPDHKKDRIRALWHHLRTHKDYDIIHYHTASKIGAPVCGMMRALCPKAKIIVHSHIVYPPLTLTWRAAHGVYQLFADYFLGCGVAAGRFVFGDHIDQKPNFAVACNAVDQGRFHPDATARASTRARYGIADAERLAGFVGRLNHQKNPLFLMEVFAALAKTDPAWKLMLVGTGEMEGEMRAAAARHGLTDRVLFAGVQSDVPAFMNAFDVFLLPSNFEGSPVTLVEAQGCGVPCLASTNVPDDGAVTDLVHFLPLDAPLTQWAATAQSIAGRGPHADHWAELSAAGYELHTAAARMEQLYDQLGGQP
ncbi:glycosyltransferase [uncultured Subdoligranulum sp.]|uniref:Glycosyltransferase n=1 Tax=Candidatus Gemmiger excrementavium TaxID=2838608 RepID=A0A9D2F4W8_9FIRM|nr:glycosyltransferase [uncultured Subdoligranulum sp.]HIZ49413.1 glycosyltransferase [Candidatus Gemmiger excrementavium]